MRMPGRPPWRAAICAHATRRAAFTAAVICPAVLAPRPISLSVRHAVGTGRHRAEQPAPVADHPEVADRLAAIRDRAGQVGKHPAPVVHH